MSDVLLLLKKRIFHFNILFVVQTQIKIVFFSLNDLIDLYFTIICVGLVQER